MVQNLKLKHNLLVSRLKSKTADKKVLAENVKWTTKFERLGSTDACMAVGGYFFKQNTGAQKPQMNEVALVMSILLKIFLACILHSC